jgi:alanyl-tRNA synthetase
MQRLYYENPYQKEFTAEIVNVIEKDNKYHIELDKTYFYPTGAVHPGDTGLINSSPVSSVYEENGTLYHVVEIKPIKIHRVKCTIDWKRRFYYMQQHLCQHIISACFAELFNSNTVDFSFGDDCLRIGIDKVIGTEEIEKVEKLSNDIVMDNINIEALYPTKSELKKLSLRKTQEKIKEEARVIKIGDFDARFCSGLHPNSTIEVQLIKIIKWDKYKNGTRIELLCGSRAVSDYFSKYSSMHRIISILSSNESEVLSEVQELKNELQKSLSEKRALENEILQYEIQSMLSSCENIKDIRVLKSIYDNSDIKYIEKLASKLVSYPNVIVLFAVKSQDKVQLIFMRSRDLNIVSMNTLLKDAITLIDGKGGGSDFSAQGGGKNNNNLDSTMAYAFNKIRELIMSS